MMKLTKVFVLLICQASVAHASVFTPDKAYEIQQIMGYDANAQIEGHNMPLEQAETSGSAKRQKVYDEEQNYECTKNNCEVGYTFSTEATVARETEIEKAGFIKDENGVIKNTKGYLDKAMATIKEAKNKFDFLSGGYTDCKPTTETTTNSSEETCDEYYDIKHNSCFARQVIEINPKYTYQCSKKRDIKEKLCTDVLKKLTCKKNAECDSGGIVLKGLASDMQWSYSYPMLTLGTIADNYWTSPCGKFDRNTTFEVKNKNQIQEFRIVRVGFDDYLRVTVNGVQVYNQPYGGDLLAIERGKVAKSDQQILQIRNHKGKHRLFTGGYSCELSKSNNLAVNIDLLPYIKEGMNELKIEVVVAGAGEGWVQIKTKQHCCTEWIEEREEQCVFL